mmetsp:Transcript_2109/g.6433  ORF Transcript_2109/g.6433 Transcript_2109/m.6433 type:complete len:88 (-) Transcript_2109:245-508(-)
MGTKRLYHSQHFSLPLALHHVGWEGATSKDPESLCVEDLVAGPCKSQTCCREVVTHFPGIRLEYANLGGWISILDERHLEDNHSVVR